MNIKKEVTSLVLSLCLLGNIMVTPVASAASPAELLDKYFPSISALREGSAGKNSILEDLELLDQWRSLVDQGMEKLNELAARLKEKGMALVLDNFAGQINDYVNEKAPLKIEAGYETKIVPVVTVGSKGYIGAAQISGPKEQVAKCRAALIVEGKLASGAVRVQYLIPIDTDRPAALENIHRVQGVGVSARLDLGLPE